MKNNTKVLLTLLLVLTLPLTIPLAIVSMATVFTVIMFVIGG